MKGARGQSKMRGTNLKWQPRSENRDQLCFSSHELQLHRTCPAHFAVSIFNLTQFTQKEDGKRLQKGDI